LEGGASANVLLGSRSSDNDNYSGGRNFDNE
jgi:hypothetical protein